MCGQCSSNRSSCQHISKLSVDNFRTEISKRTVGELTTCFKCKEDRQTAKRIGLCLVCAFVFCNKEGEEVPHGLRHFLHNRSHFMAMAQNGRVFCYKCEAFVEHSLMNSESTKAFREFCGIQTEAQERHQVILYQPDPEPILIEESGKKPQPLAKPEPELEPKTTTPHREEETKGEENPSGLFSEFNPKDGSTYRAQKPSPEVVHKSPKYMEPAVSNYVVRDEGQSAGGAPVMERAGKRPKVDRAALGKVFDEKDDEDVIVEKIDILEDRLRELQEKLKLEAEKKHKDDLEREEKERLEKLAMEAKAKRDKLEQEKLDKLNKEREARLAEERRKQAEIDKIKREAEEKLRKEYQDQMDLLNAQLRKKKEEDAARMAKAAQEDQARINNEYKGKAEQLSQELKGKHAEIARDKQAKEEQLRKMKTAPPRALQRRTVNEGMRYAEPEVVEHGGRTMYVPYGERSTVTAQLMPEPSSAPPIVRGLIVCFTKGNTSYINAVMQSLYASKALVAGYLNPMNTKWTNTTFNKRLQDFFLDYAAGQGPFDPIPYVNEALEFKAGSFNYLEDQDPEDMLDRLFTALIYTQSRIVRLSQGLTEDAPVNSSQTFFGRFVTSSLYTHSTCNKCKNSDWSFHEDQVIHVTPSQALEMVPEEKTDPKKYVLEDIDKESCYVPRNAKARTDKDLATALINTFRRKSTANKLCEGCHEMQEFTQTHFIRNTPEILIVRLDRKENEPAAHVKINTLLFLDDIWIIDSKKLSNKMVQGKVLDLEKEGQLNVCGFELIAVITGKKPEVREGDDTYNAYVRCGTDWYLTGDSFTEKVDEEVVLESDAYILFYRRTLDLLYQDLLY